MAILIIFAATMVGALMPSFEPTAPAIDERERVIQVDSMEERNSIGWINDHQ